jgi:hypothetical protein
MKGVKVAQNPSRLMNTMKNYVDSKNISKAIYLIIRY